MGKIRKIMAVVIMTSCLAGCGKAVPTQTACRFVVRVDVEGRTENKRLQRTYDSQEKMVAVLNCLRALRSLGPAKNDPAMLAGNGFDVRVVYSDGHSGLYRLRSERYLSKNAEPWQLVNPEQAQCLPPLLEQMPSDL